MIFSRGAILTHTGVILCKVANMIKPGIIPTVHETESPFRQRENIANYLEACKKMGLRETDCFVTQSLFEGDNMVVVIDNIRVLSILSQNPNVGFAGPFCEGTEGG